jgi:hypothetical protein
MRNPSHGGNPDKSRRLRRILGYLKSARNYGCTGAELQSWSRSLAPATDIADLRKNGFVVERVCEGVNAAGRQVNRYFFKGRDPILSAVSDIRRISRGNK